MTGPVRTLDHERLADVFDRSARRSAVCAIPLALVALVDLATGALTGDSRLDVALLAAAAIALAAAFSLRRHSRRFRGGQPWNRGG
jgi:hypothetical protein